MKTKWLLFVVLLLPTWSLYMVKGVVYLMSGDLVRGFTYLVTVVGGWFCYKYIFAARLDYADKNNTVSNLTLRFVPRDECPRN